MPRVTASATAMIRQTVRRRRMTGQGSCRSVAAPRAQSFRSMGSSEPARAVIGERMTKLDRAVAAIVAELRRQEPTNGEFFYVDASNTAATVIDATIDLEALARVVIEEVEKP